MPLFWVVNRTKFELRGINGELGGIPAEVGGMNHKIRGII